MDESRLRRWGRQGYALGREVLAYFPVGTAILAAAAVAASLWPALCRLLIDWREVRFGADGWRPFTGHLTHGSAAHLLLNLSVFVPLGTIRERQVGSKRFVLEYLLLGAAVAIGVRCLHDGWSTYCGLSGIVYGLIAAVCLEHERWGLAVVTVLGLKTALELVGGGWLAGAAGLEQTLGVSYLPGAHAAGLAAGAGIAWDQRRRAGHRSGLRETSSHRASCPLRPS